MNIIKPPESLCTNNPSIRSVFLAGSIEMGKAENWQTKILNYPYLEGLNIYNPRRDDWDSTWKQEYENPQFYQQVNWELNALDKADRILFYFAPNTKSPISLLELGLHANTGKCIVCCPKEFWRRGNVEIVCEKYNIPLYEHLEELLIMEF